MKTYLFIGLLVLSANSYGQMRLGAQSGVSHLTVEGYNLTITNTFSIGHVFKNGFSLGVQFNFPFAHKKSLQENIYYCDSFEYFDWYPECVGNDSIVSSNVNYVYREKAIGPFMMYQFKLPNDRLQLGVGTSIKFHRLIRTREIMDPLVYTLINEPASAISYNLIGRITYYTLEDKQLEFFAEGNLGKFYSRQDVCDDFNCDNFLENIWNTTSSLQAGIAWTFKED